MIRLSRKFIKRSIVGLALLAPIVYLFGTQFAALAGAHGEEVFAEPVYTDQFVISNDVSIGERANLVINEDISPLFEPYNTRYYLFPFVYENVSYNEVGFSRTAERFYFYKDASTVLFLVEKINDEYVYNVPLPWSLTGIVANQDFLDFYYDYLQPFCDLYTLKPVPSDVVVENSSAYTDYLFGNMFGKSNFVTEWGSDSISDNPHGFAPFGVLLKTIDENVLHLSDVQIGLMCYGYFYYCAHVLIFAFVFECATFFISWCSSIFNKFGGKDNGD